MGRMRLRTWKQLRCDAMLVLLFPDKRGRGRAAENTFRGFLLYKLVIEYTFFIKMSNRRRFIFYKRLSIIIGSFPFPGSWSPVEGALLVTAAASFRRRRRQRDKRIAAEGEEKRRKTLRRLGLIEGGDTEARERRSGTNNQPPVAAANEINLYRKQPRSLYPTLDSSPSILLLASLITFPPSRSYVSDSQGERRSACFLLLRMV